LDLGELQEEQLSLLDIIVLYALSIPEFLPIALPVTLLLALLYALTNHARYHEITAIRAAGVSLARLCLPYFAIGLLASGTVFALNEYCIPLTSEMAEQLRAGGSTAERREARHITRNLAFANAPQGRFWRVAMYNQRTGQMIQPHVDWRLRDGSNREIFADRGVYTNNVWVFFNVREVRRGPGSQSHGMPIPATNEVRFPEFTETPAEIRSEIKIGESFSYQSKTRRADLPIREILNYQKLHPRPERSMRAWLETKLHGRLAGPFTCLVVVVIAIPFAAGSGRRNVFVGVAASIVIFFAYYMLQQVGLAFGEAGRVPPWLGAWLPNIVFATVGLIMTTRVR
jgi:lipopolysaccharide export system permease protein